MLLFSYLNLQFIFSCLFSIVPGLLLIYAGQNLSERVDKRLSTICSIAGVCSVLYALSQLTWI